MAGASENSFLPRTGVETYGDSAYETRTEDIKGAYRELGVAQGNSRRQFSERQERDLCFFCYSRTSRTSLWNAPLLERCLNKNLLAVFSPESTASCSMDNAALLA